MKSWPTKKLGELTDVRMGETLIKKDLTGDGTPIFSAGIDIKPWGFTKKNTLTFSKNSIVLSARGTIGEPRLPLLKKFTATQTTIVVTNKSENVLDTIFLWRFLQTFNFNTIKNQAAIPMMTVSDVNKTEILLPPLKIQKRIVARIEELFEKIDKVKKLRQKALEEAGQIFPAALEEIFKKAVRKYSKQEIEEILELNQSGIWGDKPEELKNSYPVIRSTEITHEGELNLNSVAIRKIVPNKVSKYSLADGDILIVKSSGSANLIGRCSLFKQSKEDKKIYLFSNFIQRLRPNTKIVIPEFLYYFLNFEGKKFVQYLMTTTTGLRNLPIKQYVKLQIPHPSLPEQKKIVVYLDSLREKVDKLKQFQQSQLKELTELKQSILAKAFKG